MLHQKFKLSEEYPEAFLTSYVCERDIEISPRSAVVICPGGGYTIVSPREAEPVARRFFGEGMNVYVLNYSVGERAKYNVPLIQAALAIKLVRERAELDNTDPQKIFVIGFSAGGHLAASAGIFWNMPILRDAMGISEGRAPEGINRPDGMILCYPVITAEKYANVGTIRRVSGHQELTEDDVEKFSLERHIDSTTPPAFIWHTVTDKTVPVQNSLLLASALAEAGISFEAHIFPKGPHGLSLCNEQTSNGRPEFELPQVEVWADLAVRWIKER